MAQRTTLSKQSKLRLLIYGKPGSGKTTFAASAGRDQRSAPVLWYDAGGNPISVARAGVARHVDVMKVEAITDLQDAYAWLANGQNPKAAYARTYQLRGGYKTLVFDGITHLQRLGGDAITGAINTLPGAIPPLMQWPEYRQVLAQMILIASRFYELDMHIIVTALEHPEMRVIVPGIQTTANTFTYREPALYGQSVDEFPAWALNVGRMAIVDAYEPKIVRATPGADTAYSIVQFKPTRYVDAKDQHGLGDFIAAPTVAKMLDAIEAKADRPARQPADNDPASAG